MAQRATIDSRDVSNPQKNKNKNKKYNQSPTPSYSR
jgi:hypothetical protein